MANGMNDGYPWQVDRCEWTVGYLWHCMSWFGRLDVIVLALMLVYVFAVVIRYYSARRLRRIDGADLKKFAAVLNIKTRSLKSIALTAPCLGLAGTCLGCLGILNATLPIIATRIALALIPTTAAIPVAVLATYSHNYLRTRLDLLEGAVFEDGQERGRHFPRANRFPPTERFAELPAFGLLGPLPAFGLFAALGLTLFLKVYMPFPSLPTPRGFYVELSSECCEYDVVDQLIVLHITDTGKLFLNQKQADWSSLADRLSEIYRLRQHPRLYLLADPGVSFKTVAEAVDIADNEGIKVRLLTPKTFNADCLLKPVVTGSSH